MSIQPRKLALWIGPVLSVLIYFVATHHQLGSAAALTAAVATLCVTWWMFEPIPIPVTSIIPFAVFQLTGVLSSDQVAQSYGNSLILLLLGGFLLSKAMERSGAHRRLALFMITLCGGSSSRQLVFGFMIAASVLSMWVSNTATTLMLVPVALAIISSAEDKNLAAPLLLGIAYASSIGGLGTPIGTPGNLVLMQVYQDQSGELLTFSDWMRWGVPTVVCMIPLAALWLTRHLSYRGGFHLPDTGEWRAEEKRVLWIFALTALAWITRQEPFGGWSHLLGVDGVNDASVALLAVVLMFIVPNGRGGQLLDWEFAVTIPWGVLILFGGGICLATAFVASGLSALVGEALSAVTLLPVIVMIFLLCLGVTFLTETTSNTASIVLLMPILAAAALSAEMDLRWLMVPAAMSASCAFMLPVATAPNTIIYGCGQVSTQLMAREGVVLNLIGAIVITLVCYVILT